MAKKLTPEAKALKQKKAKLKAFVIAGLRKSSFRWPARQEARKRANVGYGQYQCQSCKEIFGPKEIKVDHIDPVVSPIEGFVGWDEYINRLFCDVDGFQVCCETCHDAKTFTEKELRKVYRAKRKAEDQ